MPTEVLERLCRAYLSPVYAYFRVALQIPPHDAQDLALEFAARLGKCVDNLRQRGRPQQGRFRDFLRACARHYAFNALQGQRTKKRGGGLEILSLEEHLDWLEIAGPAGEEWREAEIAFDREWATLLVKQAQAAVADEYRRDGRLEEHRALAPFLTAPPPNGAHSAVADQAGISADASKKRLERLRGRFRNHLRALIRGTLAHPSELDDELRYLMRAWASGEDSGSSGS